MTESLNIPIPPGVETSGLLRWGYWTWHELYTERQLAAICATLRELSVLESEPMVKRRLLLAIIGFAEMGGYAARWDPKYRKVYEILANHYYSKVVLSAEVNPLSEIGRGTLPHRFEQAVRAARWFSGSKSSYVSTGSSEKQSVPDSCVDLVITDPPYYDNIQYAELSELFLTFGRACGIELRETEALNREAVPNSTLNRTHQDYIDILQNVFAETARTLKSDGRMLLTFHHNRLIAWEALAEALKAAGFTVTALRVVSSENETDFAKRNRRAITMDIVFECSHKPKRKMNVFFRKDLEDNIAKNLLALGLAVAWQSQSKHSSFAECFKLELAKLGGTPIFIR